MNSHTPDTAQDLHAERLPYEPPEFEVASIRVVTLGGTPGGEGDSGAPFAEYPLGGGSRSDFEDEGDEEKGPFG